MVRRALYALGVLAGLALLIVGTVVAVEGYAATGGPDGAVRGYFAALARGDAAGAVAFGTIPHGPHTLLTGAVLREQQRIAPIRAVHVGPVRQHGAAGTVAVSYALAFPGTTVPVHTTVRVHRTHGDWRLDQVAVPAVLDVHGGVQRMSIVGAGVPAGDTLLFPGALPIRLDTPYLHFVPDQDTITFGAPATVDVTAEPTTAAKSALAAAVRTGLQHCLASAGAGCPLPDERYVPGTLKGTLAGALHTSSVELTTTDPAGTLDYIGTVGVHGSWRRLDFSDVAVRGGGTVDLPVYARAYAVPPLRMWWTTP